MARLNTLMSTRARRNGGSVWCSQIPSLMETSIAGFQPNLLVACNMLNTENMRGKRQWLDIGARVVLAGRLASAFEVRNNLADQPIGIAKSWAELGATWMCIDRRTEGDANNARADVMAIVHKSPPHQANFVDVFTTMWNRTRDDINKPPVPVADIRPYMVNPPAHVVVSMQSYRFFKASAHAIRWSDFFNLSPEEANALDLIKAAPVNGVNMPDFTANLREDWTTIWSNCPESTILAYCEMVNDIHHTRCTASNIAATVGIIFAICKSGNISDGWINRQITRLSDAWAPLVFTNLITIPAIQNFVKVSITSEANLESIYKYLMECYTAMGNQYLQCVRWVIEQVRAHNYVQAISFGHVNVDTKMRCLPYLMRNVSELQWTKLAEITYRLVTDSWFGLIKTTVVANEFKDLSNFGTYVYALINAQFTRYGGAFMPGGTLTRDEIRNALKMENVVKAEIPDIEVRNIGGRIFAYNNDGLEIDLRQMIDVHLAHQQAQNAGQAGPAAAAPRIVIRERRPIIGQVEDIIGDNGVVLDNPIQNMRKHWPAQARRLPLNARELTKSHIGDTFDYLIRTKPRLNAGRIVANYLAQAGTQSPLHPFDNDVNRLTVRSRFHECPADLYQAVMELGFIPPNVGADPAARDEEGLDNLLTFTKEPRETRLEQIIQGAHHIAGQNKKASVYSQ